MSSIPTVPLAYNDFVTQIAVLAVEQTQTTNGVVQGVDAPFNSMLPQALQYAELRIQRDLDLKALESLQSGIYTTTAGQDFVRVSVNDFIVIDTVLVDSRPPLHPVSRVFLQNIYGAGSTPAPPQFFAIGGGDGTTDGATTFNLLFGPIPDNAYGITLTGKIRANSLNSYATTGQAANTYTYISTYLPDMLLCAAMVFVSGFQRNFSAQSDEADTAVSWESQYQTLLAAAQSEEARRNLRAAAWSSAPQAPVASPTR